MQTVDETTHYERRDILRQAAAFGTLAAVGGIAAVTPAEARRTGGLGEVFAPQYRDRVPFTVLGFGGPLPDNDRCQTAEAAPRDDRGVRISYDGTNFWFYLIVPEHKADMQVGDRFEFVNKRPMRCRNKTSWVRAAYRPVE